MKALIVGIVILLAVAIFFFRVSRYAHWRPNLRKDGGDGFGNHAEQHRLEEDHPVTFSAGDSSTSRESQEKGLGYWR